MNEPGGAFSESQDFRASCALPFMMKWGGKISPAAFPQARTVTCSRLPVFDCMYFVPVLMKKYCDLFHRDHELVQRNEGKEETDIKMKNLNLGEEGQYFR